MEKNSYHMIPCDAYALNAQFAEGTQFISYQRSRQCYYFNELVLQVHYSRLAFQSLFSPIIPLIIIVS